MSENHLRLFQHQLKFLKETRQKMGSRTFKNQLELLIIGVS
jgi:anthranilate phosphoribosyltransferase